MIIMTIYKRRELNVRLKNTSTIKTGDTRYCVGKEPKIFKWRNATGIRILNRIKFKVNFQPFTFSFMQLCSSQKVSVFLFVFKP